MKSGQENFNLMAFWSNFVNFLFFYNNLWGRKRPHPVERGIAKHW